MKQCIAIIFACSCLFSAASFASQADVVTAEEKPPNQQLHIPRVHAGTSPFYNYVVALLQMTLDVTANEYGEVTLVADAEPTVQERQLRNLENQYLDITWSVTSFEREDNSLAVYVPIAGGLFGKRVAIVGKNDNRFRSPLPLATLQKLRAVQEESWPDTTILRSSGCRVVGAPYQSAFRMLKKQFVDYYPRGVLEISYELENQEKKLLTLERNLLISYPSAMFFFVSKNNVALAKRIEEGLNTLIKSSEYQRLLHRQEFYQRAQALLENRVEYVIPNPLLSAPAQQAYEHYIPLVTTYQPAS